MQPTDVDNTQAVTPPSHTQPDSAGAHRPESVVLTGRLWTWILLIEAAHALLGAVITLLDPSLLRAAVTKQIDAMPDGTALPAGIVDVAMVASVVMSAGLSLIIVGVLAWMVRTVVRPGRWAAGGRRLLLFFGFYYVLRAVTVFSLHPGGTSVPVAFYAVDGAAQVVVGVVAAMALVFLFRQDTLRWTGEVVRRGPGGGPQA